MCPRCARHTQMDKIVMVPDRLELKASGENSFKHVFSIRGFDQLTVRPGAMRPEKGGDQCTSYPAGLLSSS